MRDELLRDHMREGTRFVERSLELQKPVSWCLAVIYGAQIGVLGIALLLILDPRTTWLDVLVFGDSVATVVATVKLAKSYDRALRPKPEPIDLIEEELP